jgi:hypothetical protein
LGWAAIKITTAKTEVEYPQLVINGPFLPPEAKKIAQTGLDVAYSSHKDIAAFFSG